MLDHLLPGKRLYLLGTGTGLAPFMSIIRDPETYERFEHVVVAHGVRHVSDLGYRDYIENELPQHELVGERRQAAAAATTRPSRASRSATRAASPTCWRAASCPPTSACRRSTPSTIA